MRWLPLLIIVVLLGIGSLVIINKYKDTRHYPLLVLSLIYFVGLSVILFTPISFDGTSIYIMSPGIGNVNKTRLYLHGLGFIENIILTIPIGILLKKLVSQLPLFVLGLLGLVISSGIEVTQYYMSHYFLINRSTDINDIIANTLGIIVGGILMLFYSKYKEN